MFQYVESIKVTKESCNDAINNYILGCYSYYSYQDGAKTASRSPHGV